MEGFIVNHRPPTDNGSGFPTKNITNIHICDALTYTKHIGLVTYEIESHEKARGKTAWYHCVEQHATYASSIG